MPNNIHQQVLTACEGVPPLPPNVLHWGSNRNLPDQAIHNQATVVDVIQAIAWLSGGRFGYNVAYALSPYQIHIDVRDLLVDALSGFCVTPCCKPIGDKWTGVGDLIEKLKPTSPWVERHAAVQFWRESLSRTVHLFPARTNKSLWDHAPSKSEWLLREKPADEAGAVAFYSALLDEQSIMFGTIIGSALPEYVGMPKYRSIDAYDPAKLDERAWRLGTIKPDERPVLWIDPSNAPDAKLLRDQRRFDGVTIVMWPGPFHSEIADGVDPYRHLKGYVDFARRWHGLALWTWVGDE